MAVGISTSLKPAAAGWEPATPNPRLCLGDKINRTNDSPASFPPAPDCARVWLAAAGVGFLTGVPKTVIVTVGFSFFITSFAIGGGGTGWLIQGEVFPTAVEGRAAAIGAAVDWIANFAIIQVFPAWNRAIGLGWVMVCFAGIAILAIVFVGRWLPETKGLSVEDAVKVFEQQAEGSRSAIA